MELSLYPKLEATRWCETVPLLDWEVFSRARRELDSSPPFSNETMGVSTPVLQG